MSKFLGVPSVWAVHDGKVGMRNQVLGLAEALGWPFVEKRVALRFPWSHVLVPPLPRPAAMMARGSDALAPPWPDIVIGCSRIAAIAGLAVKRASGGRSFAIHIQDPRMRRAEFDALVVPEHDRFRGANVVLTRGAVHRVTPGKLAEAASRAAADYADLPRPRVAVLIGGNNRSYKLGMDRLALLGDQLAALCRKAGAGLMVTPSRRTGEAGERLLRAKLAGLPARIWDGSGDNPYFAFLGLADAILVTGDSVNMVTEAAATGKPVHVIELEGGSAKFQRFHDGFAAAGVTRPFSGTLEHWRYAPLNDTARAAAEIRHRLGFTLAQAAE
jgi:uncharacterized protein